MSILFRAFAGLCLAVGLVACAPTAPDGPMTVPSSGDFAPEQAGIGPQYAADDPCKGVVPYLCPR